MSISLTVTYLPGDRYLNTFMYALIEIPAYALCWLLSDKYEYALIPNNYGSSTMHQHVVLYYIRPISE